MLVQKNVVKNKNVVTGARRSDTAEDSEEDDDHEDSDGDNWNNGVRDNGA